MPLHLSQSYPTNRTLLQATPRERVGRVLDLGTGCGIIGMYAALQFDGGTGILSKGLVSVSLDLGCLSWHTWMPRVH